MAKNVLVISNCVRGDCDPLRQLATSIRTKLSGSVSSYFGDDLMRLSEHALESVNPSYIVLGLTANSFDRTSEGAAIERRILLYAIEHKIQLGIICDDDGRLDAPHITNDVRDLVRHIVSKCAVLGTLSNSLYPKACEYIADDARTVPPELASGIARLLGSRTLAVEPVTRSFQQAASNTGWSNNQLTD